MCLCVCRRHRHTYTDCYVQRCSFENENLMDEVMGMNSPWNTIRKHSIEARASGNSFCAEFMNYFLLFADQTLFFECQIQPFFECTSHFKSNRNPSYLTFLYFTLNIFLHSYFSDVVPPPRAPSSSGYFVL